MICELCKRYTEQMRNRDSVCPSCYTPKIRREAARLWTAKRYASNEGRVFKLTLREWLGLLHEADWRCTTCHGGNYGMTRISPEVRGPADVAVVCRRCQGAFPPMLETLTETRVRRIYFRALRNILRNWEDWLGEREVSEQAAIDWARTLLEWGYSPGTTARYLQRLATAEEGVRGPRLRVAVQTLLRLSKERGG